jgi:hypothetical protein
MLVCRFNMFQILLCLSSGVPLSCVQTCKPSGLCSAGLLVVYAAQRKSGHFLCAAHTTNSSALHNPDGLQVWTQESGTHYCTPEDGHTNARNMLSQ